MTLTVATSVSVYRMDMPRWGGAPASCTAATQHGGRVNRPGVEARYLAMETDTPVVLTPNKVLS